MSAVLELLRKPDAVEPTYLELRRVVGSETNRPFKRKHQTHIRKLEGIRSRLLQEEARFIPCLTIHQAKGREWNEVGVRLTEAETDLLRDGLSSAEENHRKLYVALTRARRSTVLV
ncbi:3'-5' exonuclease [Actinomadura sp. 6N118]|uniref:3'-5' exonuclease n=1 Tax=Actinomadura sp. 6N118 TaxID=3375151 RepID=UPI0037B665D3